MRDCTNLSEMSDSTSGDLSYVKTKVAAEGTKASLEKKPSVISQLHADNFHNAAKAACRAAYAVVDDIAGHPVASAHLHIAVRHLNNAMETALTQQQAAIRRLVSSKQNAIIQSQHDLTASMLFEFTGLHAELDQLHQEQQEKKQQQQQRAAHELFLDMASIQQEFAQSLYAAWEEAIHRVGHGIRPTQNVASPQTSPRTSAVPVDLLGGSPRNECDIRSDPASTMFDLLDGFSNVATDERSHAGQIPSHEPHEAKMLGAQCATVPVDLLDDLLTSGTSGSRTCASTAAFPEAETPVAAPTAEIDGESVELVAESDMPYEGACIAEDSRSIETRVQEWAEGKSTRALLACLHEIAPPGTWTERKLADLLTPRMVKLAYKDALLAFHPDKSPTHSVFGRCIVNALVAAFKNDK
eukprot:TRINITY_DN27789_c1_g2_i1.p1 TRINITY_DN27789_c1_g2~~TRINITY_DN27789_c1_g2_i1.p1  ORF type:complete len:412 (-),score=42.00 TRINITY_DN27789_c1_g2_i1:183-1418(-)